MPFINKKSLHKIMSHKVINCHDSWTYFHLSRVQRKPIFRLAQKGKIPASCNYDDNCDFTFSKKLHCLSEKWGKNPLVWLQNYSALALGLLSFTCFSATKYSQNLLCNNNVGSQFAFTALKFYFSVTTDHSVSIILVLLWPSFIKVWCSLQPLFWELVIFQVHMFLTVWQE